jgi:hypothetical protein
MILKHLGVGYANCNTGLGSFSDDLDRLKKAVDYLEGNKND